MGRKRGNGEEDLDDPGQGDLLEPAPVPEEPETGPVGEGEGWTNPVEASDDLPEGPSSPELPRVPPKGRTFDAPPRDLPRDLVDRVESMEAEGELYGALELVDEGLVGHELSPALLMRRVRILARLRRFDEAEEPLRTLRLVEPHAPEVKLASGMLWFRKGLYAQAERDLRVISFKDEVEDRVRREAEYYLAECLNRLSRLDEALELLHTSVKRFPQPRSFQLLGRLYDRNGSPDEAAIMYRIAREMAT
jgi:tetratricopeptide (TPR) repeat protein